MQRTLERELKVPETAVGEAIGRSRTLARFKLGRTRIGGSVGVTADLARLLRWVCLDGNPCWRPTGIGAVIEPVSEEAPQRVWIRSLLCDR